jgi:3-hydroxyacyl-[acyl-carrier-protein] dehydratase
VRFVLVDRLLAIDPGRGISAQTVFPGSLELFADHFPGRPVVPGTLLTEAMGQAAGWLLSSMCSFQRLPYLIAIDQAKFFKPVFPGEEITLRATIQSARDSDFEINADAHVGGVRVARARLLFRIESLIDGDDRPTERWARETFSRLGGNAL